MTNSTNITVAKTRLKTKNSTVTESSAGDNKIDGSATLELKAKRKFELPQDTKKSMTLPKSTQ